MIIENSHNVQTNLKNSVEFSMSEDSSKIFSLLSVALYKDKERSVMTELCSNAIDAHKMVGKDATPITVVLPTELQKEFCVRDYGPGLSESDVYQLLTRYGSSTKMKSNNFIGGFGIGAKSPISVTDTWTVNSYHEGVHTSYLIHVGQNGVPNINKLFHKETSESGIEVIIPTKTPRCWYDAVQPTFKYYDVLPEIRGMLKVITPAKWKYEYKDLYKVEDANSTHGTRLIINKRAYALQEDKFKEYDHIFKCNNFTIPFETGELSVSLSREDLQYDVNTIKSISSRFEAIYEALKADWSNDVSPSATLFEYQLKIKGFEDNHHLCRSVLLERFAKECGDKFYSLVDFNQINAFLVKLTSTAPKITIIERKHQRDVKLSQFQSVGSFGYKTYVPYNAISKEYLFEFRVNGKEDILFVLKDAHASISRCRNLLLNDDTVRSIALMEKEEFDLIPEEFNKGLASTMDKMPVVKSTKTVVESNIYRLTGKRFERVLESEIDQTKDTVCLNFTKATTMDSIPQLDHKFYNMFKDEVAVYFVRLGDEKPSYMISSEQWVKKTHDELSSLRNEIQLTHHKSTLIHFHGYGNLCEWILSSKIYKDPQFRTQHPSVFNDVVEEIDEIMKSTVDLTIKAKFNILVACENYLGVQTTSLKEVNYREKLDKTYPMLQMLSNSYYDQHKMNVVFEYVKQCGC